MARVMGYGKYWNFERVIAKAQAWTSQKGYHLGEHFVEITEMAELGNGAVREVTIIRLSRAACMAVAMNADQKKEMVKVAQQYFSATGTTPLAVEQGLMKNIPKEKWSDAHHWLIWHGRKICKARKPACDICPLAPVCPSAEPLAGSDTKTK